MRGPTLRTRSRKPARQASPCTTSASDKPASIHYPTCSGRRARRASSEAKNCLAPWRAFIASSSLRDLPIWGMRMRTDFYEASGSEVELFKRAYEQRLAVMLTGPTGCGKTRLVEHMGQVLN